MSSMILRSHVDVRQCNVSAGAFPRRLRQRLAGRRGRDWRKNFAAVETPSAIHWAHNVGSGGSHSEEVLVHLLEKVKEPILQAFSDRSMCRTCEATFTSTLRARGAPELGILYVYSIVAHNHGSATDRARKIAEWWEPNRR